MKKLVVGLVIGLVVGGGSIAIAQTTTTSADFCVKDNGKIRLTVDATCESGEELLTIEGAQGPPGLPGQDGTDGQDGIDGQDGQDGADGTHGVDGQDGTDGVDGMDGVSGYEIVTLAPEWGGGGFTRETTVLCPTGKKALSGGWDIPRIWHAQDDSDEFGFDDLETYPLADGSGWWFKFWGDWSGAVQPIPLYVVCADA
ncbi:MAG TPA: hypothetical protein VJ978_04075 [Nitriliruptoraceae bacterium]|nr:hypothetical protein [Nitriliruptoraceae bacterium]